MDLQIFIICTPVCSHNTEYDLLGVVDYFLGHSAARDWELQEIPCTTAAQTQVLMALHAASQGAGC